MLQRVPVPVSLKKWKSSCNQRLVPFNLWPVCCESFREWVWNSTLPTTAAVERLYNSAQQELSCHYDSAKWLISCSTKSYFWSADLCDDFIWLKHFGDIRASSMYSSRFFTPFLTHYSGETWFLHLNYCIGCRGYISISNVYICLWSPLEQELIRRWDSGRELSRSAPRKLPEFAEITQNNGHYVVQGRSRSPILIPIESSYTISY